MKFGERIAKIPRQIIFLLIAAAVLLPLIIPVGLMINVTPQTKKIYDAIEQLDSTSKPVLISCDFDPQTMPEIYPMLLGVLSQCFSRNVKVLVMALWPQGAGMAELGINETNALFNKKYGEDYVFLGYKAGGAAVIIGLGDRIKNVFPLDYYNRPLDSIPLTSNLINYDDLSLVISLSTGEPGFRQWLYYGQSKFGMKVATGVTAVSAADAFPYLNSGQLIGMFGGMKGAAEYETMLAKNGYRMPNQNATKAMDAQSLGHLFIILFIIVGNVGFFLMRRQK
ncbi:MAG TPA: hypothetical protein VF399_12195 [bacterium]|jgi:hypothetical protein